MSIKFRKPTWPLLLSSLPFFSVGIGFLLLSILPTLYLGASVAMWDRVSATLTAANLESYSGDGTTYRATASYRYEYKGKQYSSTQVGFSDGSDNIGDWQYDTGRQLERIYSGEKVVNAYVNPNSPANSYLYPDIRWGLLGFKLIFTVVFGGIGGFMFFASFISRPNSVVELKGGNARATQKSQSDHIYSSARKTFFFLLGIAIFVGAVSSPVLFAIAEEWNSGNKAILIALIFPLASLGLFIAAVKEGLRLLKFGRSPLVMSPYPAGIGGHLGATIQINTPYQSQQRFKVLLNCVHRYTTRSNGKSQTSQQTVWHEEGLAYVERGINNKTKLRFAFNIPAGQPETSKASSSYHYWRIDVAADMPGTKFKRSFEVPVLKVQNPSSTQQYLAVDHSAMAELVDHRISKINADDRGSEIELTVPRFSYTLERLGSMLFGSVFVGAGVGVSIGGAPFIFPLLFVPIGSIIFLITLRNYITAIRVIVNKEGISCRRSFIGILKKEKEISIANLDGFSIKKASTWQSNSGTTRYYFAINANNRYGKHITVVDRVEGKESAEALVKKFDKIIKQ